MDVKRVKRLREMDREGEIRCKDIKKNTNTNIFIHPAPPAEIFCNFAIPNTRRMIQRIQTLYLILVALACVLLFFFPLALYYDEMQGNYKFFIYGVTAMDPEPRVIFPSLFALPLVVITVFSFLLSVLTIFLYRKRLLQIRLCAFNLLATIVLIMVIFFFYASKIRTMTGIEPEYSYLGMGLPLVSLVLLILANQAIRKDEALVKSTDRLR